MQIAVHDHQNKSKALQAALRDAGHAVVSGRQVSAALLIDFDGDVARYGEYIERAYAAGRPVFLYSHGAEPVVVWDGVWEPNPQVSAYLAQSEGQKEVMQAYDYPFPIHVIGWHYCEIVPFQPVERVRNVLFAPWHPHGNGYLHPDRAQVNADTFKALLDVEGLDLTVRHIHPLNFNGIPQVDGVTYKRGSVDTTHADIDAADVVVACGTMAYLAIARGKPTIMFGQNVRPLDGHDPDTVRYVANWEKYADLMRFPYDAADGPMVDLLHQASQFEPVKWKAKFIGEQMDGPKFAQLIERLVQVYSVVYA